MDKLRTVITDDETLSLDLLEALLREHPLIDLVARCRSGAEVLAVVDDTAVDLLFLDIDMPEIDGLEVVRRFRSETPPMVIFATAHAEFAVDAFDASAIDYVLKPFDDERVFAAVEKAALQRALREDDGGVARGLLADAADRPSGVALPVKDRGRTNLIALSDILWVEGAGDYAVLHTASGTFTARMTLKDLEGQLQRAGFLRVHRSTIVAASSVVAVAARPKGEAVLTLSDGTEVKVSRTYRAAVEALTGRASH